MEQETLEIERRWVVYGLTPEMFEGPGERFIQGYYQDEEKQPCRVRIINAAKAVKGRKVGRGRTRSDATAV